MSVLSDKWISKMNNMKHASENKLIKRYTKKVIIINKESGEEKIFDSVTNCAEFGEKWVYDLGQRSRSCC